MSEGVIATVCKEVITPVRELVRVYSDPALEALDVGHSELARDVIEIGLPFGLVMFVLWLVSYYFSDSSSSTHIKERLRVQEKEQEQQQQDQTQQQQQQQLEEQEVLPETVVVKQEEQQQQQEQEQEEQQQDEEESKPKKKTTKRSKSISPVKKAKRGRRKTFAAESALPEEDDLPKPEITVPSPRKRGGRKQTKADRAYTPSRSSTRSRKAPAFYQPTEGRWTRD